MKKLMLIPLLLLVFSVLADDGIPPLGPRSVLKFYDGSYDGTKLMEFGSICLQGTDNLEFLFNEVAAKYGKPFKERKLRDHFQATSWYAANPAYHDGLLSDVDRENLRRIHAVEKRSGDASGLLRDLKAGTRVRSGDGRLEAVFDQKKYVFTFDGRQIELSTGIEVSGTPASDVNGYYFIQYQGLTYIGIPMFGRWDVSHYATIGFRYEPGTRVFFDVTVEGEIW